MTKHRISYFDGLRGLAALQVVLDHYSWLFVPNYVASFGFFANGQCAVFLFFLMSGFVLTKSFENMPNRVILNAVRRIIRLAAPYFVSICVAAILMWITKHNIQSAAKFSNSGYFRRIAAAPRFASLFADLSGLSLLFGYNETKLFAWPGLTSQPTALNPPLWTLSIELWGSFWILFLTFLRSKTRLVYLTTLLASIFLVGINPLNLFTFGHICSGSVRRSMTIPGIGIIVLGIALCDSNTLQFITTSFHYVPFGILKLYDWFDWQTEIGATMIFFGLQYTPTLQRLLEKRLPQYFGRISFSIYLLHFPIMMALGSTIFLDMIPFGRGPAAAAIFLIVAAVLFPVSGLFNLYCDQSVIRACRRVNFELHWPQWMTLRTRR